MVGTRNIVILTGAGISAESGVPTFRTKGGATYWEVYEDDLVPKYHRVEKGRTLYVSYPLCPHA